MDKILLFIPAYNCEDQIVRTLASLDKSVIRFLTEVVVVNNRSTDSTEERAADFCQTHPEIPLKVIRNDENYGLGGSHKVAFSYAIQYQFDYIIVLHGDDQADIHDFLPVLKHRIYQKYDAVLGSRFMRKSLRTNYSLFRTVGNYICNILFSVVCRYKVCDLGSGLNMYKSESLKRKYYKRFPDNLSFNVCMLFGVNFYRQHICFWPISWREKDQVSNFRLVQMTWIFIRLLSGYFFTRPRFIKKEMREVPRKEYTYTVIKYK